MVVVLKFLMPLGLKASSNEMLKSGCIMLYGNRVCGRSSFSDVLTALNFVLM